MAEPGVCPLAVFRPTDSFGYPTGEKGGNQPLFFVDHIISGFKRRMDEADWFPSGNPSVHFAIGRDGSVSQYVRIQDAAWGNGVTGSFRGDRTGIEKYDRANRHLAELERMCGGNWSARTNDAGVINNFALILNGRNLPNTHCISIEHEDEAKGGQIAWTDKMLESDIAVKRWCVEEIVRLGLPPMVVDQDCLVGHFQLDAVNRSECPGSAWPKDKILAALMGGATLSVADGVWHKQDVWPAFFSQDDGLKIAGGQRQKINTRVDFGWPANLRYGEVELLLRRGYVVVRHGDGTEAGRVGYGVVAGSPSYGVVKVAPDRDGWIELSAEDAANAVQFDRAHALAYWT